MPTYNVFMTLYTVNQVYDETISRFIKSDKQTTEEVKQEILKYQKKRHITVKRMYVTGPHNLEKREK